MGRSTNGSVKVKGLPLMMRVSYFGYPALYPSYFEWLNATFMHIGNGNDVDAEGNFCKISLSPALKAARHKKIPPEWFIAPPQDKEIFPFYRESLLGQLRDRKVKATPEIRKHLTAFLDYIELNAMNPISVDYNGERTNIVMVAQEILTRKM